jgi:hypothetical protein
MHSTGQLLSSSFRTIFLSAIAALLMANQHSRRSAEFRSAHRGTSGEDATVRLPAGPSG